MSPFGHFAFLCSNGNLESIRRAKLDDLLKRLRRIQAAASQSSS